jgi:hypothetical protein
MSYDQIWQGHWPFELNLEYLVLGVLVDELCHHVPALVGPRREQVHRLDQQLQVITVPLLKCNMIRFKMESIRCYCPFR